MAKSKKVRRGREVYERLLAERDREGLTWVALSERSGVPISTLQEWARRLRAESRPAFVEVGSVEFAGPCSRSISPADVAYVSRCASTRTPCGLS